MTDKPMNVYKLAAIVVVTVAIFATAGYLVATFVL